MASSITISGLASGLPADIVDQLMQAESKRLTTLQTQKTTYQTEQSAVSTLKTKLLALKTKVESLQSASSFSPRTASSSDEDVLKVTASSTATPGVHSVTVNHLASYQTVVSNGGISDRTAALVDSGGGSITFDYDGVSQTISLDGDATINDVAQAITNQTYVDSNGDALAATKGVTGSVMYDGSNYRLVLTPREGGVQSGGTSQHIENVSFSGVNLVDTSGNSDVSLTDNLGTNADVVINGVTISSQTNSLSSAIPGVTLNLRAGGTATVNVGNDTSTLQTTVNDFIKSYNEIVSYIRTESQKGGALSKDATMARNILSKIRTELNIPTNSSTSPYNAVSSFSTLAQIGLQTDKDTGTLSLDSTKFSNAVATRFDAVAEIFTSKPSASESAAFEAAGAKEGIAYRLDDLLTSMTTVTTGTVSTRSTGISNRIRSIDTQIDREQRRLEKVREQLTKKFASLDQLASSMNSSVSSLQSSLSKLS